MNVSSLASRRVVFKPLVSNEGRTQTDQGLLLSAIATVPMGGLMAVAMANDSGKMPPYLRTAQSLLLPYAFSTSVLVGLVAAPVVLGAAALVSGFAHTVGRIPVPHFERAAPSAP